MLTKFNINPNIEEAETICSDFYQNETFFIESKEKIFSPSWQLITDINTLDKTNIYPFFYFKGYLDEPLMIIKDGDNINSFSNVCTHRAHQIINKPCKLKILSCPYHGRKFDLNGKYKSMIGFDNIKNFPNESDNLHHIPIKKWKNFFFISLNPQSNISFVLQDIENRLPNFPFDQLKYDSNASNTWIIDAHWALYCENYLEGFHIPFIHKGLAKDINSQSYETIILDDGVLQIAKGQDNFKILQNFKNTQQNIYALYYWIYPNMMLNFYPWGVSINIIEPISPVKTRVRFLSYPIFPNKQPINNNASINTVELEDQLVVQSVQKGINSKYYKHGRYSPYYEKGVHHFHLLLDKSFS